MLLHQHTADFLLDRMEHRKIRRTYQQIKIATATVDQIGNRQIQTPQNIACGRFSQQLQIKRTRRSPRAH